MKKDFRKTSGPSGATAPAGGRMTDAFRVSCRHETFCKEVESICAETTLGALRRALVRNGWEETGNGKGGHIQYAKPGINDRITLVSRNHDSEKLHRYVPEQIRELYARAFPRQFDAALVERAYAKAPGKRENYAVPAARMPANQAALA
jgi:predicted RNA binding protein YcfA (HicA-like mRNA interferase family)